MIKGGWKMTDEKKTVKAFAVLYLILGSLGFIFSLLEFGSLGLTNLILSALKVFLGAILLQYLRHSSKISLCLTGAVIVLLGDAAVAVLNFLRGDGLFGLAVDLLSVAIAFYLVSILNRIKKSL